MAHIINERAPFFAGDTPPEWAVEFARTDMEHLRQFYILYRGMDGAQHPKLAESKVTGQALELAKSYPDEHACRASMWFSAIKSMTPEQEVRFRFPTITDEDLSIIVRERSITTSV